MFPWEKHTMLQAVGISPHPFTPCQLPEEDVRGKYVKGQQKQKTLWGLGSQGLAYQNSPIRDFPPGVLTLWSQLTPAVPQTWTRSSLPFVLIKWSVWISLWAEHTVDLKHLKMTGRRNRSRIINPPMIPKLIKLHKELFWTKFLTELVNQLATSFVEDICSLEWLITLIWEWRISILIINSWQLFQTSYRWAELAPRTSLIYCKAEE